MKGQMRQKVSKSNTQDKSELTNSASIIWMIMYISILPNNYHLYRQYSPHSNLLTQRKGQITYYLNKYSFTSAFIFKFLGTLALKVSQILCLHLSNGPLLFVTVYFNINRIVCISGKHPGPSVHTVPHHVRHYTAQPQALEQEGWGVNL